VLAFSIAGGVLMGWLADRCSKKYVMVAIYLLVAIAAPSLFVGASKWPAGAAVLSAYESQSQG